MPACPPRIVWDPSRQADVPFLSGDDFVQGITGAVPVRSEERFRALSVLATTRMRMRRSDPKEWSLERKYCLLNPGKYRSVAAM
jgi:hypothetical protein